MEKESQELPIEKEAPPIEEEPSEELSNECFNDEEHQPFLALRQFLQHFPSQSNARQWLYGHREYQEGKNRWDYMFLQFLELEHRDGDCVEVTKIFADEDAPVVDWVFCQRHQYLWGNLEIERLIQLEAIGFEWGCELEFLPAFVHKCSHSKKK